MLKKSTLCAALLLAAACATDEGDDAAGGALVEDTTPSVTAQPEREAAMQATAELRNAEGATVGTATLQEGEGGVRIALQVSGLPPGQHGFHVHTTGECTAPGFDSAGGHFNPTAAQHGLENPQGPHAGDMENFEVTADSTATFATDNDRITLAAGPNSVLDADGSAIVIHAAADDNLTDPSGNSGARIACGVITAG